MGIYHPTHNPEGTALIAYDPDGNGLQMLKWYEVPDSANNSLSDCFDESKIAIYKLDSNGNITVSTLDQQDGSYMLTGTIESKVSGRPDGIYADEINERDVEDLRMNAHKKPFKEILDEMNTKAITDEIRGKENENRLLGFTVINDERSDSLLYKSDFDNISEFLLDVRKVLYYNLTKNFYFATNGNGYTYKTSGLSNSCYKAGDIIIPISWMYGSLSNTEDNTESMLKVKYDSKGLYKKSYKYNNTLTHTDIIGDPRKLQDRIEYTVGDDEQINIHKNEYILCDDSSSNSGKKGHLYRNLGDSLSNIHTNDDSQGDANKDGGHIDFSKTDTWLDLGTDLTIGEYNQVWLDKGFNGTPLILGENGESLLPVDIGVFIINSDIYLKKLKLSKKLISKKKILVSKKDGSFTTFPSTLLWYSTYNAYEMNLTDSYSDLGYASAQEMLDLMKIIVTYETKANNMEIANNSEVLELRETVANINEYSLALLVQNTINKVPVGTYSGDTQIGRLIDFRYRSWDKNKLDGGNTNIISNTGTLYFNDNIVPAIKYFAYLTQINNRAYLQYVFKELKYDSNTNTWGDDNKFKIVDEVSTVTDNNNKTVLIGQKRIPTNYFISEED